MGLFTNYSRALTEAWNSLRLNFEYTRARDERIARLSELTLDALSRGKQKVVSDVFEVERAKRPPVASLDVSSAGIAQLERVGSIVDAVRAGGAIPDGLDKATLESVQRWQDADLRYTELLESYRERFLS